MFLNTEMYTRGDLTLLSFKKPDYFIKHFTFNNIKYCKNH